MDLMYHLLIAPRLMPAPPAALMLLRGLGGELMLFPDGPLYGFASADRRDLAHWVLIHQYGLGASTRLGIVAERAV